MSCGKYKKADCQGPECTWVVGKGCKPASEAKASSSKSKSSEKLCKPLPTPNFSAESCAGQILPGVDGKYESKKTTKGFEWVKVVSKPKSKTPSPPKPAAAKPKSPLPKKSLPPGCEPSTLKKYTSRNSPPYPAANCCGVILPGKDGMYISKEDKNGVCKWQKHSGSSPKATKSSVTTSPKATKPTDPDFKEVVKMHNISEEMQGKLIKNGIGGKKIKDWASLKEMCYFPTYADLHWVDLKGKELEAYEEDDLSVFTKHKTKEWKRGDVIIVKSQAGYRNRGKVMWDGNKAISLDFEDDDYGSVPKEFKVGEEFSPYHWSLYDDKVGAIIDHNRIIRVKFNSEIAKKMNAFVKKCAKQDIKDELESYEDYETFIFEFKGQKWAVIVNIENDWQQEKALKFNTLDSNGEGVLFPFDILFTKEELKKIFVKSEYEFSKLVEQGVPCQNIMFLNQVLIS